MKRGLLALVALLSACSAGPDFHRPEPPPVHAYSTQASPGQNLVLGAAIPARPASARTINSLRIMIVRFIAQPYPLWRQFFKPLDHPLLAQSGAQ